MATRDRSASLTQLLTEATTGASDVPEPAAPVAPKAAPPPPPEPEGRRRGERMLAREATPATPRRSPEGHVRESDGSYVRADGERRVALQLKMHPDDKRSLKVQAAAAGLTPAEYVALLVREDTR